MTSHIATSGCQVEQVPRRSHEFDVVSPALSMIATKKNTESLGPLDLGWFSGKTLPRLLDYCFGSVEYDVPLWYPSTT
jgi:hypothetical protein